MATVMGLYAQLMDYHHKLLPDHFPASRGNIRNQMKDREEGLGCDLYKFYTKTKAGNTLIGIAYYTIEVVKDDECAMQIMDFVIDEKYRGRGYGTQMMNKLLKIAAKRNCYYLKLNVCPQNKAAVKLYKRFGMQPLSTIMYKFLEN
jgi:ribosomal protein S18 acetylase RimI-like enzyme